MFLNKKSPLYMRVHSPVADLLFLKNMDAISISDRYPEIWKNIIIKTFGKYKNNIKFNSKNFIYLL